MQHLQEAETFLASRTENTYLAISNYKEDIRYLDIAQLFNLDEFLQNRVIAHWLIDQKVSFTLTESLIDEIKRFLHQPENKSHVLDKTWAISKKNNQVFVKKIVT